MEPTVKEIPSHLSVDLALAVDGQGYAAPVSVPVHQAIAALGEPETTVELAQRLFATVGMMWSDVVGADMFLPQGGSGELRGVRDVHAGVALLSAVGSSYGAEPALKVIPVTPCLVP